LILDVLRIAAPSLLLAGTAWAVGLRRGRAEGHARTERLVAEREGAERRAREAAMEASRLRGISLAGAGLSREPIYAGRPSARDAVELAGIVRGLALVDDVIVTDDGGLPVTREIDASPGLSAIGGACARAARGFAIGAMPVVELAVASYSAEHVVVRRLPDRAEGHWLVVKSTSQRPNPLAVDAVVHAASRVVREPAPPLACLAGTTERRAHEATFADFYADLDRELRNDLRALSLLLDGAPVYATVDDGPDEPTRAIAARELALLATRARRLLRTTGTARVEATFRDGSRATWAALAPQSRLALVAFGRLDERAVDRLAGRLRRFTAAHAEGRAA